MDPFHFPYSLKNIPIPPEKSFIKQTIDKTANFISRIRWATDVFLFPDKYENERNNYGFKSNRTAPVSILLKPFEDELYETIANLEFHEFRSEFQNKMADSVAKINKSPNVFLLGDKTSNIYEVSVDFYNKYHLINITKDYKIVDDNLVHLTNQEAAVIAKKLDIADRVEIMSRKEGFMSLKDHKPDFQTNPKFRLINPAKSQIGNISRDILQRVNKSLRLTTGLQQWQSTQEVIDWFNGLQGKGRKSFLQWDICEFYPSITEPLLHEAIEFAQDKNVLIEEDEISIIMHSRKAFLFSYNSEGKQITWQKTRNSNFDVTMGAPDGAEVCELVGLFLLHKISIAFPRLNIGLYRDDGLATHGRMPGRELEQTRQKLQTLMKSFGLKITFENSTQRVNFLDITLDLSKETFGPYRKPNDTPLYVNAESNHPPKTIQQIPKSINARLSRISSSEEEFKKATPIYQQALADSGHTHRLTMDTNHTATHRRRSPTHHKKRKIIYYTPPFNKALKTKLGRIFLGLVRKHFPPHHKLYPILNKNTLKISYSCTANIKTIIQAHNRKVIKNHKDKTAPTVKKNGKECNCQATRKDSCPLQGNCVRHNVVYKATVQGPNPKFYIGVTENFKARWHQHRQSFKNRDMQHATALSTFIWEEGLGREPDLRWEIIDQAPTYMPGHRTCQLCLTEKLQILRHGRDKNCLNKRSELAQTCRHRASHRLCRVKGIT